MPGDRRGLRAPAPSSLSLSSARSDVSDSSRRRESAGDGGAKKGTIPGGSRKISSQNVSQKEEVDATQPNENVEERVSWIKGGNAAETRLEITDIEKPMSERTVDDTSGDTNEETKQTDVNANVEEKGSDTSHLQEFDCKKFPSVISEYCRIFDSSKFTKVDSDFPVDELNDIVANITRVIGGFKEYTLASQEQLEELRYKMKNIKDLIHGSVQRKAFQITPDELYQSVEERELTAKIASLNAEIAKANAGLAVVLRLSMETENTAAQAAKAAYDAAAEAQQIRIEMEVRAKFEAERRVEEEKRKEVERRTKEVEERKLEDETRKKDLEWRRREGFPDRVEPWENWPIHTFDCDTSQFEFNINCIIRGNPALFNAQHVTCDVISQSETTLTYEHQEEVVSPIIHLSATGGEENLKGPLYVAIPYMFSRATAHTREPVIKMEQHGAWVELHTRDVTFDAYKEYKFAQVEISELSSLVVFSRLKRDYATFTKRPFRMTSSADIRVTFTIPQDTFEDKEHFQLEVQHIDSASVADLRSQNTAMKGLLTSSPILRSAWQSEEFTNPITVTVPCPPNPAKAKKMAAMRAAKEAKMKIPLRQLQMLEMQEDEKEKMRMKQYQQEQEEDKKKQEHRWYMGQYGDNDDDEHDKLFLVQYHASNNRWSLVRDVDVVPIKLDLVEFSMIAPIASFVVLRTRLSVLEEEVSALASSVSSYMSKRKTNVILRQRTDDPYDVIAQVVSSKLAAKALQTMEEDGYTIGSASATGVLLQEGDVIGMEFRGNVRPIGSVPDMIYNSHMNTKASMCLVEVNKYLQKNSPTFRGFVRFYKKFAVLCNRVPRQRKKIVSEVTMEDVRPDEPEHTVVYEKEFLCELLVNIPKDRVSPNTIPICAPITIINTSDSLSDTTMRHLADQLGDEWRKIAQFLNVRRTRLQAIMRNSRTASEPENEAKYAMLMSWLKRVPKAMNKVDVLGRILSRCGRTDLADDIRNKERQFKTQQLISTTG